MSCANPALMESLSLVREGVNSRRAERGCKAAISEFARFVGLPERRVFGLYYGQSRQILADEYLTLREKAAEWMAADIARLEAKIALDRARYDALMVGR